MSELIALEIMSALYNCWTDMCFTYLSSRRRFFPVLLTKRNMLRIHIEERGMRLVVRGKARKISSKTTADFGALKWQKSRYAQMS